MGKFICDCYSKLAFISHEICSHEDGFKWFIHNNFNLIFFGNIEEDWFWLDIGSGFAEASKYEWECIPYLRVKTFDTSSYSKEEIIEILKKHLKYKHHVNNESRLY